MFNRVAKTAVSVGVIGATAMLILMFAVHLYKYFTLAAADYVQYNVPEILSTGIFVFFLVALAGLLGIAAQWLDRHSR